MRADEPDPARGNDHGRTDAGATIALAGDIDGGAREALDAAYAEVAGDDAGAARLQPASDYINSTGIALIVGVLARARAQERPVSACGLTEHYREIFEITRLSDFMTILADGPVPAADETEARDDRRDHRRLERAYAQAGLQRDRDHAGR